jgi:hypothetical protein
MKSRAAIGQGAEAAPWRPPFLDKGRAVSQGLSQGLLEGQRSRVRLLIGIRGGFFGGIQGLKSFYGVTVVH